MPFFMFIDQSLALKKSLILLASGICINLGAAKKKMTTTEEKIIPNLLSKFE